MTTGRYRIGALAAVLLAACQTAPAQAPALDEIPEAKWRAVDPENLVLLNMGDGTIALELFPEAAPANAEAVRAAIRSGFYDGEFFYRVIEGHVAQAGGEFEPVVEGWPTVPLEAERSVSAEGFVPLGNADLFAAETGHRNGFAVGRAGEQEWLLNCPGTLGMARSADPDSGSTEFFIPLMPRRYLDRNYTIFGRVIDGMDIVNQLQRVEPSTEEEAEALFGEDEPLAHQIRQYRRSKLDPNMIVSAKIAADLPEETRPSYEVMATPSAEWEELKESKRNYGIYDAFVVEPPRIVDICTLPVPARPTGND